MNFAYKRADNGALPLATQISFVSAAWSGRNQSDSSAPVDASHRTARTTWQILF